MTHTTAPRVIPMPQKSMEEITAAARTMAAACKPLMDQGRRHAANGLGYPTYGVFLQAATVALRTKSERRAEPLADVLHNYFTIGYNAQQNGGRRC